MAVTRELRDRSKLIPLSEQQRRQQQEARQRWEGEEAGGQRQQKRADGSLSSHQVIKVIEVIKAIKQGFSNLSGTPM